MITWSPHHHYLALHFFILSCHFFLTMQASIAFIVYQQKANIFNFLQMAAKYGPTSSLPYRTNPKKAEPRSLCRLFPPHFQKLPTLVMNVMRMPNTPDWLHRFWLLNFIEFLSSIRHLKCFIIPTSILTTSCCGCWCIREISFFHCRIAGNRQAKTLVMD